MFTKKKLYLILGSLLTLVAIVLIGTFTEHLVRASNDKDYAFHSDIECDGKGCLALAKQGNPDAQVEMGWTVHFDEENDAKAFQWYKKAADQGHIRGKFEVADLYFYGGEKFKKDLDKSLSHYLELAEDGYSEAQYMVGQIHRYGFGDSKKIDPGAAFKWYHAAAQNGDSWSAKEVAHSYYTGTGVDQNYLKASHWYRFYLVMEFIDNYIYLEFIAFLIFLGLLAFGCRKLILWKPKFVIGATGSVAVLVLIILGATYIQVKDTLHRESYWNHVNGFSKHACIYQKDCIKPAKEGDVEAQYAQGWLSDKNVKQRVKWWKKAAEQGHKESEFSLAEMYLYGDQGLPKNTKKGLKMFTELAENDFVNAQKRLGYLYSDEEEYYGLPYDLEESFKWYKKAADNGHYRGAEEVMYMYLHGDGVTKSFWHALNWYRKFIVLDFIYWN